MSKVILLILLRVIVRLIPCICYSVEQKPDRNTMISQDDGLGYRNVYQCFGASSCQSNNQKDIEDAMKTVCPLQNKREERISEQVSVLSEKIDAVQNKSAESVAKQFSAFSESIDAIQNLSEKMFGEQLDRLSTKIEILQNRHKEKVDEQFNVLAENLDRKFEKMEGLENSTKDKLEQLEALVKRMENKLDNITQEVITAINASCLGIGSCPLGYLHYKANKFCYKFHRVCKPWSEAREVCQQEGGDLISLKETNFEFFQELARTNAGGCSHPYVWVGTTDAASEGNWFWLNGEKVTSVFWYPGQPDSARIENCGDLVQFWDYKLNDQVCSEKVNFMCQIYL